MSYSLLKDIITYAEAFDKDFVGEKNVKNFSQWLHYQLNPNGASDSEVPEWEGKAQGRSAESVINTSLVHLFRYAKIYSKIAVSESPFTTIDDVIFLLNLLHRGSMTKKNLINLNIHEKSTGIQIINRLLSKGFITEDVHETDKRSRTVSITSEGQAALESNMDKIRQATKTVAGNLSPKEKLQLIALLQKLELYHEQKIKGMESVGFED